VVYKTKDNKVAGFARYDAKAELTERQVELDAIKEELVALRSEVEVLKGTERTASSRRKKPAPDKG
jgi:hypothetical protein